MSYCFEGSDLIIENGIIKGSSSPRVIDYKNYGEMILERMRSNPNFVGQIDSLTGNEETFAEMAKKSVKCALWLRNQNVKPRDVVGICTYNRMDMYVPCFASLYIGAVYNAWWNAGLTKEMTKHFITLTEPKVVFADEFTADVILETIKEVDYDLRVVILGEKSGQILTESQMTVQSLDDILKSQDPSCESEFHCTELSSLHEPAAIIYTSGSTGLPKGVVYTHHILFHNIQSFAECAPLEKCISLIFSPLSWLTGFLCMHRGIVALEKRIICPEFTEETCCQLVEKYKVNWSLLGASTAMRLQKSSILSNYDLSSLKCLPVGGSVISTDFQKALVETFPGVYICQAYGSTELGALGIRQKPNHKPGSCGTIVKNLWMKIIECETGRTLNPNETGEVCFKSDFIMKCYYRNPEATRETIDSEGWLHMGDLGYYDEEGNFFFVDRLKEIIKHRGYHISPSMIEQLLQKHAGVQEAAVVSIPHSIDDEHPIAFVVLKPEVSVTAEELEKMVADVLPDYMKLRGGVEFLNEFPRTSSGKIAKNVLKNLAKTHVRK